MEPPFRNFISDTWLKLWSNHFVRKIVTIYTFLSLYLSYIYLDFSRSQNKTPGDINGRYQTSFYLSNKKIASNSILSTIGYIMIFNLLFLTVRLNMVFKRSLRKFTWRASWTPMRSCSEYLKYSLYTNSSTQASCLQLQYSSYMSTNSSTWVFTIGYWKRNKTIRLKKIKQSR